MAPKIGSKFTIERDKSIKTPISNPVKTSTTSSQLTDELSKVKLGSFGSLSNSTLAKSLKTSSAGVSEAEEVATDTKTEETVVDETDVSLFTRETSGGASDVNDLDSTLSKLENDDACLNSMNKTISSAKASLASANGNIELANKAADTGDFQTALSYWQAAQEDIEKARQEAQKAGDENLQREIQVQAEVCKGQIEWLTREINSPLNSITSPIGGVPCSGNSGNSFASSLGTGIQNGLTTAAENAGKNLFGGNKTNGTGSAGGTGGTNKSSGTGKTPTSTKSSGSNKSKELQYDKSNKEIAQAVKDSKAEDTYNKGTGMIEQANKALPDAKSSLEDATREISCANIDIEELTETNREYLEKYSGAKQRVYDITTKIEEQNKIQMAQSEISKECQGKITELSSQEETKKGSVRDAERGVENSKKSLDKSKADLKSAEGELSKAQGLPDTDKTKAAKVSKAEKEVENAKVAKAKAENDFKAAKEQAELKEIQENKEMYTEKKAEADQKVIKAGNKMKSLAPEKTKATEELNKIRDSVERLGDKEKALKERLDKAYKKKTNAQNTISECEQKIIAGRK